MCRLMSGANEASPGESVLLFDWCAIVAALNNLIRLRLVRGACKVTYPSLPKEKGGQA